jgi:hypothetical protein
MAAYSMMFAKSFVEKGKVSQRAAKQIESLIGESKRRAGEFVTKYVDVKFPDQLDSYEAALGKFNYIAGGDTSRSSAILNKKEASDSSTPEEKLSATISARYLEYARDMSKCALVALRQAKSINAEYAENFDEDIATLQKQADDVEKTLSEMGS